MPKVLHIGPCETPGGMANVMRILAEHPPEGWEAELLSSHVVGSPWAKWRAYRKARRSLSLMLEDPERRPDIVHLHTAADWSWWRKRRFAQMAHKAGVVNVVHIHSGQFDSWLGSSKKRILNFLASQKQNHSQIVVLSDYWKEVYQPLIGHVTVINNPVNPSISYDPSIQRDEHHFLLLGRNTSIKGHDFAIKFVEKIRETTPHAHLTLTGVEKSSHDWVHAAGWVSEEKKINLLQKATLLLVPSKFEGQPLVALEALAANCPVIASHLVHSLPQEVVKAQYGNIPSWVDAYRNLQFNDASASSALFTVHAIQSKWAAYYSEILFSRIRAD